MNILHTILKKFLAVSTEEVRISFRGFDCPETSMIMHLEKIGLSFLEGYHQAIEDPNNYKYNLQDKMYAGFVMEGAAMGSMINDLLFFNNAKYTQALLQRFPEHVYMIHVGVGWALARVPFANITKQMSHFDPLLKDLILDGYGFHQAYFRTKTYVYDRFTPKNIKSEKLAPFYQGIGRAHWFVFGGQPEAINNSIRGYDSRYHSDLWAGVGLALAYAGGAKESQLISLQQLDPSFKTALAQGVAFACEARRKAGNIMPHTESAAQMFCQLSAEDAANITSLTKTQLMDIPGFNQHYTKWRQLIIKHFENSLTDENIEV